VEFWSGIAGRREDRSLGKEVDRTLPDGLVGLISYVTER
jgi:hypothetical protein